MRASPRLALAGLRKDPLFLTHRTLISPEPEPKTHGRELTSYPKTIQPRVLPCLKSHYWGTLRESPGPPQRRCSNWLIFLRGVE